VSVPLALMAGRTEKSAVFVSLVTLNVRVWADSSDGPALIEVAQPLSDCAGESSSTVWFAPFVNDGTSLTAVTLIVTTWVAEVSTPEFAVPPLSETSIVRSAVPFAFAAGVKLRVPFDAIAGPAEKRPAFVLFVTWNVRVWPDSSDGPVL